MEVDELCLALHPEGENEWRGGVVGIQQQLAACLSLGQYEIDGRGATNQALTRDRDLLDAPLNPVFWFVQQPQDGQSEPCGRGIVQLRQECHEQIRSFGPDRSADVLRGRYQRPRCTTSENARRSGFSIGLSGLSAG